jgi:HK97 gp10 family phage protein
MKVTAVLTGDEALNRKLATLTGPQQKKAVRQAARQAMRPVLAQAKANAPIRSGALRRNIRIQALRRSRSRIGVNVTASGKSMQPGQAYYGGMQEFGWRVGRRVRSNQAIGVKRFTRRTEAMKQQLAAVNDARPAVPGKFFMKRAADSKQDEALKIYRQHISDFVVKVAQS